MTEKELEEKLREGVENLGGLCLKWVSPGNRGVPDRIVLLPRGEVCFVELKTDVGKLSPLQKRTIKAFNKLGHRIIVLYGEKGIKQFLKVVGGRAYEI